MIVARKSIKYNEIKNGIGFQSKAKIENETSKNRYCKNLTKY